jgi:WD40 repeat protein
LKIDEQSNVLVSGSYDKTVRIWDLRSGGKAELEFIDSFKDSVFSVDIANQKKMITAGSIDGTVKTFDLRHGKLFVDHIARKYRGFPRINESIFVRCCDECLLFK